VSDEALQRVLQEAVAPDGADNSRHRHFHPAAAFDISGSLDRLLQARVASEKPRPAVFAARASDERPVA
jgi:hypothetical protein